ncbi:hypothetical protein Tco_0526661 [Tanacetum coccineum]
MLILNDGWILGPDRYSRTVIGGNPLATSSKDGRERWGVGGIRVQRIKVSAALIDTDDGVKLGPPWLLLVVDRLSGDERRKKSVGGVAPVLCRSNGGENGWDWEEKKFLWFDKATWPTLISFCGFILD